jgi:cytochrome c oxidase cbb3-type subunit 2
MYSNSSSRTGWRGVGLVAVTYVYFLIFAQFAFLKRLAALGITDPHLKTVVAAMAAGGILFSLLTPRTALIPSAHRRLQLAFAACAAAALFTLLPLSLAASIAIAFLIGAGLGTLTVTLVTHLPAWLGDRNPLLQVGLGTGLGYLICNFPPLFTTTPEHQAITAAALCLAGIFITSETSSSVAPESSPATISFPRALAGFTALIWLDSAAFFIIQNTPALKAGTWQGTAHLWTNGALHLTAALAAAWLLRRRGVSLVLTLALLALASACLLLLDPNRIILASIFYPIGVSLYSVALVAYPSLLAPAASTAQRARMSGWIYAIAGWIGSAMGIGMAQNLGRVPPLFLLLPGVVILLPWLIQLCRSRTREVLATAAVLLAAFAVNRLIMRPATPALSAGERGRQVYIAEGCINCHSQYVRPHTPDVLMWGPIQTVEELRRERPPLIGNRRQGPDLSEVGSRRSPLWLKAHFFNPPELNHASFMPSYGYLFANGSARGDDLITYVQSLHGAGTTEHLAAEGVWQPASSATDSANVNRGATLFAQYCATCHTAAGITRRRWQQGFRRLPPDLSVGPFQHVPASPLERRTRLAQIVKFGLPGTDMAGHEYLSDTDIASLTAWLEQTIPAPVTLTGEKQ